MCVCVCVTHRVALGGAVGAGGSDEVVAGERVQGVGAARGVTHPPVTVLHHGLAWPHHTPLPIHTDSVSHWVNEGLTKGPPSSTMIINKHHTHTNVTLTLMVTQRSPAAQMSEIMQHSCKPKKSMKAIF